MANAYMALDPKPHKDLTPRALYILIGMYCKSLREIYVEGEYKDDLRDLYEAQLIQPSDNINPNWHELTDKGRVHIEGLCKEPLPVAGIIWRTAREVEELLNPTKEKST